jgi:hypothetical protein
MVLPSLNVIVIARVFVIVVLVENTAEGSVVAFLSTSIAAAFARPLRRRMYPPINVEGPEFTDVPPPDLGACHNLSVDDNHPQHS